jgi:hypothetical protein
LNGILWQVRLAGTYLLRLATVFGAGLWYQELGTHMPLTTPANTTQRYINAALFFTAIPSVTVDMPAEDCSPPPEGAGAWYFRGTRVMTRKGYPAGYPFDDRSDFERG